MTQPIIDALRRREEGKQVSQPPTAASTNTDETTMDHHHHHQHQQQNLQHSVRAEDWTAVLNSLQDYPELAYCSQFHVQCQGESTRCLPFTACLARPQPCIDVLELLLNIYPAAVTTENGGRGPLHLACLKGLRSVAVLNYLRQRVPTTMSNNKFWTQPDDAGNTPLHYACQYATPDICHYLLQVAPNACQIPNHRGFLPLHVLCAWENKNTNTVPNESSASHELVQKVWQAHPAAATTADRNGRLPLHWACDTLTPPSPSLIQWLVECHSPALLVKDDKTRQTPAALAKRFVMAPKLQEFLNVRTARERSKQSALDRLFTIRVGGASSSSSSSSPQQQQQQQQQQEKRSTTTSFGSLDRWFTIRVQDKRRKVAVC